MIQKLIRRILGTKKKNTGDGTQPVVLTAAEHRIDPKLVSSNAIRVTSTLQQAGFKAFLVGGAVRDLLLGVKPKDFDIATNATPEQVKKLFRRAFIIGRRFQIVHVMFGQDLLEVTTFRGTAVDSAPKDEHGRVLRDNTFGEQHEDALRRDFTINAMYYDPASQTVLDYHGGMTDIRNKTLRIIGVPEARYREDPVRLLRVVRFAAKLNFTIAEETRAPISVMAPLINNVPAARVFDEMLKLLLSGHALACLQQLRKEGLHHGLLPLLDVVLEQPLGEKFVRLALEATDARVKQGKPVSPGFLFASLLWHQVLEKWKAYQAAGEYTIPALHLAADDVLNTQTDKLALQRKIATDMRDIWAMQPRFDRRVGKTPYKLLEHQRLRAGYDFLLLRCESGEIDREIGDWWTDFIDADSAGREELLAKKPALKSAGKAIAGETDDAAPAPAKKRRRRGGRNRNRQNSDASSADKSE
ncbi:MAG: polynucleotide adenylyltransferase PcnB [Oxalicibacterium faecigallinarum]|uniref:polynucleotide adenylyltransferase PcnB n=1 Tax=Oxalicibacterium faecigallinarum TaxID=573741 RepID=UPI002807D166|nr:polynucleotide adenylyltransferase PcnB [Oxalicibacterium faecigallinarum]MDQ7969569.1 polynucleotide adenylyltransferase PcnB [Oxalicibacterium faecigallinarum]